MTSCRRTFLPLLLTTALCLLTCASAVADDKPLDASAQTQTTTSPAPTPSSSADADDNWHLTVSPYLWFPGLSGTTGALGHDVGVHISPADLLSNFNFGLMGAGELRKGRLVLPIDFMWVKLKQNKATSFDPGISSVTLKVTQVVLTPGIGYRIVDGEKLKVDANIGIRYWHLGQNIAFEPSGIFSNFSPSANWVDALAGARIQAALSSKALATIYGSAGGGGANSDYQIVGLLGFRVSQKIILQGGWRYLDVNYRSNAPALFIFDVHESGPIFGLNWIVK
jgi:hypothetical protein